MVIKDKPLSLVIIGGFLGSGKTTLLKRMLEWEIAQGEKPIIIMSEFGKVDIDSTLIDRNSIDIKKLSGGCVCCDLRLTLTTTLEEISRASPGAHIYLETSGVADPLGVLEAVAPVASKGWLMVRKVIIVYDATLAEAMQEDRYMAERQLVAADVILMNRCDEVTTSAADQARKLVTSIKPRTPLLCTSYCQIDPGELMDERNSNESRQVLPLDTCNYKSMAFFLDRPIDRSFFEKWLREQIKKQDVLRIKGFVNFTGDSHLYEVQTVRKKYNIIPFQVLIRKRAVLIAVTHHQQADSLFKDLEEHTRNN